MLECRCTDVASKQRPLASRRADYRPHGPACSPCCQAKTANCFLLNGVVFGGSVLLLDYGLKPAVHLALSAVAGPGAAGAAGAALAGVYSLLWLFPAYLISFLVNCIWWVLGAGTGGAVREAALPRCGGPPCPCCCCSGAAPACACPRLFMPPCWLPPQHPATGTTR